MGAHPYPFYGICGIRATKLSPMLRYCHSFSFRELKLLESRTFFVVRLSIR